MGNGSVRIPSKTPVASSSTRLPSVLQFPLVVLLSFSASYILLSGASAFTKLGLASVSRRIEDGWWRILAFPLWRIVELAVGWFGGYDDYDMASLTLQTRLPYYYLLTTFYGIPLSTTSIYLFLDTLSATLPFYLMRRRLPVHAPTAKTGSISNNSVIMDWGIFAMTSSLSATLYSLVVYFSFATWIPVHMVTFFDNILSVEAAHTAQVPTLFLTFVPLGWAANTFLFAPATAAQLTLNDIRGTAFNPADTTLLSTIRYNVWGWSKGTKVVLKRTATLAALVGLSTWIRVWKTLEGTESVGAAGWAGVWVLASTLNGLVLRWVGNV
ncbi:hypothetical protein EJ08DRAFT_732776 [Tothia fuscella]|uniref:Uncharacterized protein n=1 Tax=Tothia fuscella TaxID=1048955 RepID=A0A9P4U027_9PEZI|nr:hypothetical protein EJ08DRAFT_732776 [Tothia fuscella]